MKNWLFAAALVAAVFLAYQPAWRGEFVWDDDLHLLNNPVLKPGGLARAWVPGSYINYWPLTFTVYRLEFELWGLRPLGFHLVNIGLHAISALLLWRVLVELAVPGAMLAAAIFALHPVNVESVAWIAQLKGILSLLFAMVSALLFLQYDRQGGWWRYAAALSTFLLSTLAKGMVITLPLVLLACIWWRRGANKWYDLLRILPYVLIGALMAGVEIWTQQQQGFENVRSDSLLSRAAVAGCAVWFYIGTLLAPFDLCFIYPRWQIRDADVVAYLPGLALLMIVFALALWQRRSWGRPVVMLLICYVALLLPALGFVNIGFMQYSLVTDHWQYAASTVPCAVLTGIAAAWTFRHPERRPIAYALSLVLLITLAGLTWRQSRTWANNEALYRATIDRNPESWLAQSNLGWVLAGRGEFVEAIPHYRRALEIKPDFADAHCNLGLALASSGQAEEAIAHYLRALEIKPQYVDAYNNLGLVLANRGQIDQAISNFRKAVQFAPGFALAHDNLGLALAGIGNREEAQGHYQKALELALAKNDKTLADTIRAHIGRLGR